ncbi:hypothetical protein CB0940_08644 [Cercospora beticola]|uniref:Uncharacterized protein n=1 Tax=Cercospora beticola TaxID=122368 RepID=A0A2G5HQX2_CERBT|nr:hypothetical protein CB0940_08644 [Cercospora beticola]PIA94632.1 hypothetical protein CB0940_08644 [Cercospora beticola]WPB05225.1 hypothetical protein RHO25_009876 [Cercospora beticola]
MADRSSLELVRDWQAERDTIDDELVVVNAQATTILQKQKQLERRQSRLRCTIEYWNTTRPFKHFLRLLVEIREMIYNRYIERIHSHGKYISVDRNVFFPDEYAKSIALVSKQVREEYLNWLGLNRPLDLMMLLRVILRRQFTRSKRAAWDRLPAQMIDRVRIVDIQAGTRCYVKYRLQVARAELTMLEDHRRPGKIDPSDVHWGRVRLVAEIIIGEGGKLKKKHLELLIDALKDNDDIIDSQAWLNQALERGEAAKKLRTGKGRKKLPDSFPGSDAWWLEKWGR